MEGRRIGWTLSLPPPLSPFLCTICTLKMRGMGRKKHTKLHFIYKQQHTQKKTTQNKQKNKNKTEQNSISMEDRRECSPKWEARLNPLKVKVKTCVQSDQISSFLLFSSLEKLGFYKWHVAVPGFLPYVMCVVIFSWKCRLKCHKFIYFYYNNYNCPLSRADKRNTLIAIISTTVNVMSRKWDNFKIPFSYNF